MPAPAELGQLDASPTLFTVMAALSVAGYSADLGSPNNHPLRDQVRSELLRRHLPCEQALKDFFEAHHKRGAGADTAELAQYVSFALSVKGPPDFAFAERDVEIPPDAVPLRGFSALLARFYKEADIAELWQRSQPAIDQYIVRYHEPVLRAKSQVDAYLRQLTNGFRASRFQVFIELLAAPNQIQTRSYGTNYFIVVTPSPEPRIFDIRHAYLHYLLDPLSTREKDVPTSALPRPGRRPAGRDRCPRAATWAKSTRWRCVSSMCCGKQGTVPIIVSAKMGLSP